MTQAIRDAITRAAEEEGVDPATALAYADRESNFNPTARSSRTIRGLYQMRGDLRAKYGIGDSDDPYTQAKGWARFYKDLRGEMAGRMGRDPTDAETYLGHHFGGGRAARMLKGAISPDTHVADVFTPEEMGANPHFGRAGTVGNLTGPILADIERRRGKFGGSSTGSGAGGRQQETPDFSHLGTLAEQQPEQSGDRFAQAAPPDFSHMGTLAQGPDFSHLGTPAEQAGAV